MNNLHIQVHMVHFRAMMPQPDRLVESLLSSPLSTRQGMSLSSPADLPALLSSEAMEAGLELLIFGFLTVGGAAAHKGGDFVIGVVGVGA